MGFYCIHINNFSVILKKIIYMMSNFILMNIDYVGLEKNYICIVAIHIKLFKWKISNFFNRNS